MPAAADRTSRNYGKAMKLSVNRQAVEADAGETLAGLLQRMSVPAEGVAVAVNNRVVPRSEWAATRFTKRTASRSYAPSAADDHAPSRHYPARLRGRRGERRSASCSTEA